MASTCLGLAIDIPTRSLEALREADLLIFEEDRPARFALKQAGIHKEYIKYSEHKNTQALDLLRKSLKKGETVCYMSDQGMPTIADPGKDLLNIAYQLMAKIIVIPGPSSITSALAACPFDIDKFFYAGFLPRTPEARNNAPLVLKNKQEPIILLDTPYRKKALIDAVAETFGPIRKVLLAIDISGESEQYLYGDVKSIRANIESLDKNLNFVLIIAGNVPDTTQNKKKNPVKKNRNRTKL